MFDLHTHHDRCGHARGSLREYVDAAVAQGMHTIGLSDHSPFFAETADQRRPWVAMSKSAFPGYIAEARRLADEYRDRIQVLVGVESDFFPEHAAEYSAIYRDYPLDYIIGSVHMLGGTDLFRRERWAGAGIRELRAAKASYCDLVAQSALRGDFDILGHIDVIKAACPEMAGLEMRAVDRMLAEIARADVVVEVNTSGKTKDCGGWYPSDELLLRARRYDIKLTFGSDAHDPARVGDEHEVVRDRLRALGFAKWYVFSARRRIELPL